MRRGALMHRRGRDGDDHDDNSRRRCRHYDDNDGIAFTPAAGTHVIRTRSHMHSLTAHVMGSPGAGRRCNDDVDVDVRWPSHVHHNQCGEPTEKVAGASGTAKAKSDGLKWDRA